MSNFGNKKCHYCFDDLNPTGTGLDRKDNDKGYLIDNVVSCCCTCNRMRSDKFSYEEMLVLSVTIRAIKEKRVSNGHS